VSEAQDYQDDLTIVNDAELWRRIPNTRIIVDDDSGERRPSSQAFNDDDDGDPMSVYLAEVVLLANRSPESLLESFVGYGLAAITAGHARECQQGVFRAPTADEPAHAKVFGKKTKKVRRALAVEARWVLSPPP
jgi:hypothetical protein